MANRMFTEQAFTLEKAVVTLYADVTIAGTGAPTLVAKNSKGVKSIVRNSAGDYTVTLADQYVKFFAIWPMFIKATAPASPSFSVKAFNMTAAGGATIEFIVYNSAGTATDPASGEELLLEIDVGNSGAY